MNGSRKRQLAITVISACLLSRLVESLQLLLKLGFTEFNDVFDNTLGTAFGTVIVLMLERVKRVNMYAKFFKRFLDFILSLCAVIALSPVLLILIVLGTIFMRGNPFFFQERPGKDEKIFKLIKFRTMDNRRDAEGNLFPDSVRLNKYGRFLRSTSLEGKVIIRQTTESLVNKGFCKVSPIHFFAGCNLFPDNLMMIAA